MNEPSNYRDVPELTDREKEEYLKERGFEVTLLAGMFWVVTDDHGDQYGDGNSRAEAIEAAYWTASEDDHSGDDPLYGSPTAEEPE